MISCLRKIFLFSAVFVLVSSLKANAISPEIVLKNMQLITPEIKEEKRYIIPQNYSHNNNLRRKSGSPFFAKGQFLYRENLANQPFWLLQPPRHQQRWLLKIRHWLWGHRHVHHRQQRALLVFHNHPGLLRRQCAAHKFHCGAWWVWALGDNDVLPDAAAERARQALQITEPAQPFSHNLQAEKLHCIRSGIRKKVLVWHKIERPTS